MPRFADPLTCPSCASRLTVDVTRCPTCRVDLRSPVASELLRTLRSADDLLARLQAEAAEQPAAVAIERTPYPAPAIRPREPRTLSSASVPRILLSLGALCLLVAAVIFLAVAWTWLGVGGRTAVLVGLTAVSAGLGVALGRRGLRVAAESLTTVALGLLTLDVIGADNAGWLGALDNAGLVSLTSAAVLVAALALSATTRLIAPQLLAALAASGVGVGVLAATERWQLVCVAVVVAYAALAVASRRVGRPVLMVAAAVGGGIWWSGFTLAGLADAVDSPTWRGLWIDGHGYAFVVAALLVLLPLVVIRTPDLVRGLVAGCVAMLTVAAAVPSFDEGLTALALTGLAALAAWTALAVVLPREWRLVALVPMAIGATPVVAVVLVLVPEAVLNALDTGGVYAGSITLRLDPPEPQAAPLLLVLGVAALVTSALALVRRTPTSLLAGGAVVATAGVATLALYPTPIWVVAAAFAALGAALVGVRRGPVETGAGGLLLLAAGAVALPSAGMTALVAAVVVAAAVEVRWRGRFEGAVEAGGLVLPIASGAFIWSALAAADVAAEWRALPVLVVVGLLAIALADPAIETGAAATGAVAGSASIALAHDPVTSAAVHLTVAGALVTASALVHADRRYLGWPGGLLLAAATWVRLADLGVQAPEAYTLPTAIALLVLGLVRMYRDPATSTRRALGAGLLLATVPSLLWVLVDPGSPAQCCSASRVSCWSCSAPGCAGASRSWSARSWVEHWCCASWRRTPRPCRSGS
jgi:hypothetical protein